MLVTSELNRTWIGLFRTASTLFSIARNSPRRWTRITCFAAAKISSAISRALSPPPTTITRFPLNSCRSRTRYSTPFPELGLAGDVEPLRFEKSHAHRQQDGPGLVRVALAGSDPEAGGYPLEVHDLLGLQFRPAFAGMEGEQLRELAALDRDVARVVVDGLRRIEPLQLAAHRLGLEDQGRELPRPGVDARRKACRATPDDEQVVHHSQKRQIPSLLNVGGLRADRCTEGHGFL